LAELAWCANSSNRLKKLENGKSNITIGTLLKVMTALKAKVSFNVEKLGEVQMV
jgi:transcriptional regulator with XRE-family HTH domain